MQLKQIEHQNRFFVLFFFERCVVRLGGLTLKLCVRLLFCRTSLFVPLVLVLVQEWVVVCFMLLHCEPVRLAVVLGFGFSHVRPYLGSSSVCL